MTDADDDPKREDDLDEPDTVSGETSAPVSQEVAETEAVPDGGNNLPPDPDWFPPDLVLPPGTPDGHTAPAEPSLDQLLEEYDRSLGQEQPPVDQPQPAPWEEPAPAAVPRPEDYGAVRDFRDVLADEREQRYNQVVLEQQRREWLQREKAAFDEIVDVAQREISEDVAHLPRNYARAWLRDYALEHPEAVRMYDNRDNPRLPAQTRQMIHSRLRSVLHTMAEEARSLPDPTASADAAAVAAAVRGASTKAQPEAPLKFGGMSNSEFRKTVVSKWGFDPGV